MKATRLLRFAVSACCAVLLLTPRNFAQAPLGLFEGHDDVGTVQHQGSVKYDAAKRTYTISGSGENMWAATDAFHFVWKKVSGDVSLTADLSILGTGGNAHRKGVLMIRQSLDPDSAYVSVALHGVGLTALQSREAKGAQTYEVISNISAPTRLQILKRGQYFYMWLNRRMAGGSFRVPLTAPFYIGLGVCAHDKEAVETVVFSNVELTTGALKPARKPALYSTLETVPLAARTDRQAVLAASERIEAPNWTRDGVFLLFNSGGRIKRVSAAGGTPESLDTGAATQNDGNHGISPDGTMLAVSHRSAFGSAIFVLPVAGGTPRRVTQRSPSYWNGWSPDGKTLVFSGERSGRLDIYTVPAAGGAETRLTSLGASNLNAEYSPDGKHIYFNSDRTGSMQIWRMLADGTQQEQTTADDYSNWQPHLSPDGRWMVFLTCEKGFKELPRDWDVTLRLLSLADGKISLLAKLVGGQGTLGASAWSPDSRSVAFVSYQSIP